MDNPPSDGTGDGSEQQDPGINASGGIGDDSAGLTYTPGPGDPNYTAPNADLAPDISATSPNDLFTPSTGAPITSPQVPALASTQPPDQQSGFGQASVNNDGQAADGNDVNAAAANAAPGGTVRITDSSESTTDKNDDTSNQGIANSEVFLRVINPTVPASADVPGADASHTAQPPGSGLHFNWTTSTASQSLSIGFDVSDLSNFSLDSFTFHVNVTETESLPVNPPVPPAVSPTNADVANVAPSIPADVGLAQNSLGVPDAVSANSDLPGGDFSDQPWLNFGIPGVSRVDQDAENEARAAAPAPANLQGAANNIALVNPAAIHNGAAQIPAAAIPRFGVNAAPQSVSRHSLETLNNIAGNAGVNASALLVTSTIRTPADQARIMFDQLSRGRISRYGAPGRNVIAVFNDGRSSRLSADEIRARMTDRIQQFFDRGVMVSNHLADPARLNVFDIDPNSIPADRRADFERALDDAVQNGEINLYHGPNTPVHDPAYHLEIPQ